MRNHRLVVDNQGRLTKKSIANKSRGEKRFRGIGGKVRLASKAIKAIQGHYGAAIRVNGTVTDKQTDIWTIFHHRNGVHTNCPSWCASHEGDLDKANKHRLPSFVCDYIKPVFTRLSSDELLSKCTHGGTKNANEAYHHLLWARCPKEKFCGKSGIELATSISTITFNDGECGLSRAFADMGLSVGRYHALYAQEFDTRRVVKAYFSANPANKTKRQSKNQSDATCYEAGAF